MDVRFMLSLIIMLPELEWPAGWLVRSSPVFCFVTQIGRAHV